MLVSLRPIITTSFHFVKSTKYNEGISGLGKRKTKFNEDNVFIQVLYTNQHGPHQAAWKKTNTNKRVS